MLSVRLPGSSPSLTFLSNRALQGLDSSGLAQPDLSNLFTLNISLHLKLRLRWTFKRGVPSFSLWSGKWMQSEWTSCQSSGLMSVYSHNVLFFFKCNWYGYWLKFLWDGKTLRVEQKKHVVTINLSVVFVSWYMWALLFFYSHICKNLNNKNINIKKLLGLLLRALHLSNLLTS